MNSGIAVANLHKPGAGAYFTSILYISQAQFQILPTPQIQKLF